MKFILSHHLINNNTKYIIQTMDNTEEHKKKTSIPIRLWELGRETYQALLKYEINIISPIFDKIEIKVMNDLKSNDKLLVEIYKMTLLEKSLLTYKEKKLNKDNLKKEDFDILKEYVFGHDDIEIDRDEFIKEFVVEYEDMLDDYLFELLPIFKVMEFRGEVELLWEGTREDFMGIVFVYYELGKEIEEKNHLMST